MGTTRREILDALAHQVEADSSDLIRQETNFAILSRKIHAVITREG